MTRALLICLTFVGCPKPTVPPAAPWESVPHLPSPTASVYNRSPETPPDRPVAGLDASLSGAAAALALELVQGKPLSLTRWRVREALWRAGYPYPVDDAKAWTAGPSGAPPPQLLDWLAAVHDDDDLGLVRARGHDDDVWVALKARPAVKLGPVPRQVPLGGKLVLPAIPGATWAVADANGNLQRGDLTAPVELDAGSAGEWLVEVSVDGASVALFPVYVGMVPPAVSLITDGPSLRTAADALARTESLLAGIRDVYGATPLARDFMLDAGARSLLNGNAGSQDGVAKSLGLPAEQTALWECTGTTVEACLDRVVWKPENRRALLDDQSGLGLAARVDDAGVHLVGIVSRTTTE
jgi:hypothetical protein